MASELMASEDAIAVMRKIAKSSRGPTAQAGKTSGRAWRQSIPKSSEEHIGLIASVKMFETEVVPLDDLLAEYDESFLMTTLAGLREAQGLAMIDPALLASLIEVQTMGRVLGSEPTARTPSDTDVALVGHVIDRWSTDQERALHEGGGLAPFRGFRVKDRLEDARAASLHLQEGDYVLVRLTIDLALGARTGVLRLAYPKDAAGAADAAESEKHAIDGAAKTILGSHAELSAVLLRRTMSLQEVYALKEGSLFPVPRSAIGRVRLEDLAGHSVATVRLGQAAGNRAVLMLPPQTGEAYPGAEALGLEAPEEPGHAAPGGVAPEPGAAALGTAGETALDIETPHAAGGAPEMDELPAIDDVPEMDDLPDLGEAQAGDEADLGDTLPMGDQPQIDIPEGEEDALAPLDMAPMGDLPDLPPLKD